MFVTVSALPPDRDDDAQVPAEDADPPQPEEMPLVHGLPGRVFINPTITVEDQQLLTHEEGCLSLPGIHVDIRRPGAVTISAQDITGEPFSLKSDDFFARVWQHEFDHLDGVLIIDRMTRMDRLATRKALRELEAAAG